MKKHKYIYKKGCIIKQGDEYGCDYFRVTYVHIHKDGSQGLDVVGLFCGRNYGLDVDFCLPATEKEAFKNYKGEILTMGKFKWYRWLRGGVWAFLDTGQGWIKVVKENEEWALTEMKSFVSEDHRRIKPKLSLKRAEFD